MKYGLIALALILVSVGAWAMSGKPPAAFKLHVKMTVTVETPEGDVTGSTVREISNAAPRVRVGWPHGGNPASVSGEAVVIDLGERGKVFALIDKNDEESRFYKAFPPPNNRPQSNEAMEYYAQLPVGTSALLEQKDWPQFVIFTDMSDARTVILVWGRAFNQKIRKHEPLDRLEELFGSGIQIKNITLEITDELKTKSGILKILPKFNEEFWQWRRKLHFEDSRKISGVNFSQGVQK